VLATGEGSDTGDREDVRADAWMSGAEGDEEPAQILDVRFARRIREDRAPGASDAAMTAFSVAITEASSRWMSAPARRPLSS